MSSKITVIGNVVSPPTKNRTQNGSVTNFRMASNERRFDTATQDWIDGHSFFVDVECWGELGGNVAHSVSKGDPVVVVGAIRTHEWESEQGRRSRPQIKAEAVAPNLARGVADFRRTQRPVAAAPEEAPSGDDQGFPTSVEELVAGRDYVGQEETLDGVNPDLSAEPAHV
ncbi:single-stranded DNA-binding protein [Blastococcus sp. CT_GayMR20]|uniref:single-stranded DNA-binding protein n=1 Tax=Blastococcus sp. CT_GayMR20 TaxID=2559609 RepID=UPI0010745128|nr:single-stranded DNA-binding protein [Blastococcus sp. CT_GayMR20]TFV85931.1 single-stranded DNA-binding protein [Blastococcus sp. CT_GayMR20]